MPGYDVPYIGWIALVPLLLVLLTAEEKLIFPLSLPFGIIFSMGVHNWYPNIFPPALGYFLIFAVGAFYPNMLLLGIWLSRRFSGALSLLAIPLAWSAIEFVKYIVPVVEDWWFVLLASSAWRFPAALQILGVAGVFGLSFLVMMVNTAIAMLLLVWKQDHKLARLAMAALLAAALIVGIGGLSLPKAKNSFRVAVLTDMVYQLPQMRGLGNFAGLLEKKPGLSQALFENDAELTRQVAQEKPAFVVWSENGFADMSDQTSMAALGGLAAETGANIVVDVNWMTNNANTTRLC
jgi:apolipoprotein N-acyltransferase